MLQNYVKIALRNIAKHKGYSFINIFGLGLGLACCVLILLYVQDERSYDRFHEDADRIYRVVFDGKAPNSPPDRFAVVSWPVGRAMRAEYPEIEHLVRFSNWNPVVKHEGTYFYDDTFLIAEPSFFQVFTFPLVRGDTATALDQPFTLVMSESMERKYFGNASALGETVMLNDTLAFTVTGVMQDIPSNSHLTTDFVVSYETQLTFQPESEAWLSLGSYAYLKLHEGVDPEAFEAKISDLVTRNYGEVLQQINLSATLGLQPLPDIYLRSDRGSEIGVTGNIMYVYIFAAIALFVLLIACINFMNLATARSMERAKEVGVRKVVGSTRTALIRQFLSESVIMCLFALVIAVGLIVLALPFFNDLASKEIPFSVLLQPMYMVGLIGTALLVGLLAGSYPAFMLSGFPTIAVLKGVFRTSQRGVLLRKGLVVFQFGISVALIASTLIVFQQLDFMQSQDLGFEKERVLVINAQGLRQSHRQQYETTKAEFERVAEVSEVSVSNAIPGRGNWLQIVNPEGLEQNDSRRAQIIVVDHDYTETYQVEMAAGRDFSLDFETDAAEAIMVNEEAVKNFGWGTPEEALGKKLHFGNPDQQLTVVGVVEDYHHYSLHQSIQPMVFRVLPGAFIYYSLRLSTENLPQTLASLEQTWQTLFPGYPFETFFLDDDFNSQYQAEQQLSQIFGVFSFLAILIACLGLFGLAAFTAQQRTKEIGVRKVMGASVGGIIVLLSKEFTRLVLVAIVIAAPVAYYGMTTWLEDFPYQVAVGPGVFLLAGLLALLIAFATVSYQSIKAAVANPIKSLRYE